MKAISSLTKRQIDRPDGVDEVVHVWFSVPFVKVYFTSPSGQQLQTKAATPRERNTWLSWPRKAEEACSLVSSGARGQTGWR